MFTPIVAGVTNERKLNVNVVKRYFNVLNEVLVLPLGTISYNYVTWNLLFPTGANFPDYSLRHLLLRCIDADSGDTVSPDFSQEPVTRFVDDAVFRDGQGTSGVLVSKGGQNRIGGYLNAFRFSVVSQRAVSFPH